ncbi:hypothetical protein CLV93_11412 [Prolixibacter denitrificans]|uniref:Uncharacterized protein n=1 Tax=Prolixibacter denitrificans TaxID=1541063 RepID=A0A2P8C6J1_9BACT|nr:hypothetical protein CLV93_11412 [Prolixibacter denitrificans]
MAQCSSAGHQKMIYYTDMKITPAGMCLSCLRDNPGRTPKVIYFTKSKFNLNIQ